MIKLITHTMTGLSLCVIGATGIAQEKFSPNFETTVSHYELTKRLDQFPQEEPVFTNKANNRDGKVRYDNLKSNVEPLYADPVWQKTQGDAPNRAPITNWMGNVGANPPDPSGAAGPNHYLQMVNSAYKVWDKSGSQQGSGSLGGILGGGNDGDPIVMYDKFADRWFLSQFRVSDNSLIVAVSETEDPLGNYHLYTFSTGSNFPDYPKYSIWSDGYYVTANKNGSQCYVMERDKMLAGDNTAKMVGFNVPSMFKNGFSSPLVAHAGSTLPALGSPAYLFYFQDNEWSGVSTDHLKVWEINVNWTTTSSSTISSPVQIPVSSFSGTFSWSWDDIEQPGTTARLDGVPGAVMYMANYREFANFNSIVLNHTVDVDNTNHAGIRWYELRQSSSGGAWSVYQEGTYAPDDQSRWLGSIEQNKNGDIALAYSVSGSTIFPSIAYTGRAPGDPLGQMTYTEEFAQTGTSAKTGDNRYGDYSQMTIDPVDDMTFWFTGEYVAGAARTRVISFKLPESASVEENDIMSKTLVIGYLPNNKYTLFMHDVNEMVDVTVTSMTGEIIKTINNIKTGGRFEYTLDLNGLAAGYYVVSLKSEKMNKPHKIWVK